MWVEAGLLLLFTVDMWISYRLAYEKDEALMFNLQEVHSNYLKCGPTTSPLAVLDFAFESLCCSSERRCNWPPPQLSVS